MKTWKFAAPVVVALTLTTAAWATHSSDPAELIRERQQMMKDNGAAMKVIGGYIQAGAGSLEDVAAAAKVLIDSAAVMPDYFPEGSGMDDVADPRNGAKPVIWSGWAGFEAAAAKLGSEATAMRNAAQAGDSDAVTAQMETLGAQGCGGCHQTFRQKLE
ncbi:MAG: hypothetical protein CMM46_01610 [Rhodospirillaceae bacterium]|nr:hypothetical protein [Rhodospirillaceae bacterium]|tara:strand:+ start:115 stop:591 length:477 start_codon:yes stop_codon:yes gene_type:complete